MPTSGLDPWDAEREIVGLPVQPTERGRAGAGAIPLCLRVCWWGLMMCDAVIASDEIAAARLLDRPAIYLSLIGPFYLGATLALVAWWHTRGPGRRSWRSPASRPSP